MYIKYSVAQCKVICDIGQMKVNAAKVATNRISAQGLGDNRFC